MNFFPRKSLTLFALAGCLFFTNSPASASDATNFDLYCVRALRKTFDHYTHSNLISREEANILILNKKNEYFQKIGYVSRINAIANHYLNCPTENIIDLVIRQKKADLMSHFKVDVKNFAKKQTVDFHSLKKIISRYDKEINETINAINLEQYQNIYQYDRQDAHQESKHPPHIKLLSPGEYKNLYIKGMKKVIKKELSEMDSDCLEAWLHPIDKSDFFAMLCDTLKDLP